MSEAHQPPPKPPRPGERGAQDRLSVPQAFVRPAYAVVAAPRRPIAAPPTRAFSRPDSAKLVLQEPLPQSDLDPHSWLVRHGFNPEGDLTEQKESHRFFWIVSSVSQQMVIRSASKRHNFFFATYMD